ncbi:hypothetical protein [Burkholderia ubonensis]|uniref:hypothetical protein n=1 Tax=Burkholderia ubonensis TaxID=101571 RepID=UPI000AB01A76|nr:hypothetical protein [Burkholderia ubonensis]
MNPIRSILIQCLYVAVMMNSQMCRASADRTPLLGGAMLEFSGPLTPKEKNTFGSGWKTATYTSAEGDKFDLFPLEALTPVGGVIFGDSFPLRVSPTGKYAVIDMLRAGFIDPGPSGKPEVKSRQYCPVLDTKTGCIVSNQSGELCEGQWGRQSDRWMVPGLTDDASSEMLKHQFNDANRLWKEYANSVGKPYHLSIRETIFSNFGIYNLMACDRPGVNNIASYRNIAAELKKAGDAVSSEYVMKRLQGVANQGDQNELRKILAEKAFLFEKPNNGYRTKMYLIRGDDVRVLGAMGEEWVKIEYLGKGGRSIQKWIRTEALN